MSENPDVEQFIQNLSSEDQNIQLAAVKALGQLKDVRAVEPLVKMLKIFDGTSRIEHKRSVHFDEWFLDITIQREIVIALGEIGGERSLKTLLQILQYQDVDLLEYAAEALTKIGGTEAVDAIIKLLMGTNKWWDEYDSLGKLSKKELQKMGEPAIQRIIYLLETAYPIPSRLPEAFVEIAPEWAFEPLISALDKYSKNLKTAIIYALANLGDKSAIDPLLKELEHTPNQHEHAIVSALGRLGWEGYDHYLYQKLQNKDKNFRYTAGMRLLHRVIAGEVELFEEVITLLDDEDKTLAHNLACNFMWIEDGRLVESLVRIANHPQEDVREGVARALNNIADSRSVDALIFLLKDSLPRTRWFAVTALGKIGDKCAVEPLKQLLHDEAPWGPGDKRLICHAAAKALSEIETLK
jgi:HEAT repeat protein